MVLVHLSVHVFHVSSRTVVRFVVGVVDDVVFGQVVEDRPVLFLVCLFMADGIHLGGGGEMLDGNPDVEPFVFRGLVAFFLYFHIVSVCNRDDNTWRAIIPVHSLMIEGESLTIA